MRRIVDEQLESWASAARRKPLLVRGARQVGKTYSIRELGRTRFERTVVIDLERNRDWHRVFSGSLDARRMLSELEVLASTKVVPGKTLLFLDEIQACPRAITALRYFYEELPELHVVAAGSLLEFAMGEMSVPVGRIQHLEMHPMTFLEVLWATGNDAAAEIVAARPRLLPQATHEFLMDELRRYCFVGGMPECVLAYVNTRSLAEPFAIQQELSESFRQDFAKYAPRSDPLCLDEVLLSVVQQVGHQIHFSRLAGSFSGPTAKKALELLSRARVIRKVLSCNPSGLPLGASVRSTKLKAIFLDVGLWQHLSGMKVAAEYRKEDLLTVYRGAMAEQLVGQEMLVSQGSELFYWAREARGSSAEVDYLAVLDGAVHGVEVKSGAAGSLKSLHLLLGSHPNVADGLVFSSAPYAELASQKLRFVPLYFALSATRG